MAELLTISIASVKAVSGSNCENDDTRNWRTSIFMAVNTFHYTDTRGTAVVCTLALQVRARCLRNFSSRKKYMNVLKLTSHLGFRVGSFPSQNVDQTDCIRKFNQFDIPGIRSSGDEEKQAFGLNCISNGLLGSYVASISRIPRGITLKLWQAGRLVLTGPTPYLEATSLTA
jgi:hypothetical protein